MKKMLKKMVMLACFPCLAGGAAFAASNGTVISSPRPILKGTSINLEGCASEIVACPKSVSNCALNTEPLEYSIVTIKSQYSTKVSKIKTDELGCFHTIVSNGAYLVTDVKGANTAIHYTIGGRKNFAVSKGKNTWLDIWVAQKTSR